MLYFFAVIDWQVVWTNGLWILGAAVLLATFSYTYYLSQIQPQSLGEINQQRPFAQFFWFGFLLILLGLVFTSRRWWETAVWLLFSGWAMFNLIASWRSS